MNDFITFYLDGRIYLKYKKEHRNLATMARDFLIREGHTVTEMGEDMYKVIRAEKRLMFQ